MLLLLLFAYSPSMPEAQTLSAFLQPLAWCAGFVLAVITIWHKLRGNRPMEVATQPFLVREEQAILTKREFEAYREQERKEEYEFLNKMTGQFNELSRQRSQSIAGVHGKLDAAVAGVNEKVDTAVDALREELLGEIRHLHQQLMESLKETNSRQINQGERIAALEARQKGSRA